MKRTIDPPRASTLAARCATLAFFAAAASAVGCNGDVPTVNPAPIGANAGNGGADAGSEASASPDTGTPPDGDTPGPDAADAGPAIRTVITRSPFGKLDPENLLHDGDFELGALDTMQYPWLGIEQRYVRIGSVCRSGVRCIEMRPQRYVIGAFVWPDSPYVDASFYARITTQDCEKEGVAVITALDDENADWLMVQAETPAPVDGWCHYASTIQVPNDTGYHWWGMLLATRSEAEGPVVFDEARMVARTQAPSSTKAAHPLPQRDIRLLTEAREELRKLLPPNPPRRPAPVRNMTGSKRAN